MFAVLSTLKRKYFFFKCVTFLFILKISNAEFIPCAARNYGLGSTVCVCNETYCDSTGKIELPDLGDIHIFESNKAGARFNKITGNFTQDWTNEIESEPAAAVMVTINKQQLYQEILGFGGAFTDSAGTNIKSLPAQLQQELIEGYFSEKGLDYNMARIPIGSTDYSPRSYSHSDVPDDFSLVNFKLAPEDLELKIPFIQQAINVSKKPLLLIGSSWSAPKWMKTTKRDLGVLKGSPGGPYYKTWANYFVKFFQAFEEHNISFWGLTTQNEPLEHYFVDCSHSFCMGYSPEMERDFIKMDLGPALKTAGYDKLKLIIADDQRFALPWWAEVVLADAEAAKYVSGVAFHWYLNFLIPVEVLDMTHEMFPDKFLISTEACIIFSLKPKVKLGNWQNAESYGHDILEDLLHFTAGWIDWNIALDLLGGPNLETFRYSDGPTIVNATGKEFYRQPMYYALGHFSKFLPKGTYRIGLDATQRTQVELAAFKRPDDGLVLIAINRQDSNVTLTIRDPDIGYFTHNVTGHSIQSYLWRNS